MAINFQFNKTSLNELDKNLKLREKTLPTIKNKESALRMEVKKARNEREHLDKLLEERVAAYGNLNQLFVEFNRNLLYIEDVQIEMYKIAGVRLPRITFIKFHEVDFPFFISPFWYYDGIQIIKDLATLGIESEICYQKMILLDSARKKTTQKVNLYEKVQIPGFQGAILKIKRFLEDEENLSKSAQKIVKSHRIEEV